MKKLAGNRTLVLGASVVALLVTLGVSQFVLDRAAAAQSKGAVQAPRFEVDPLWPKPLPNHWILGSTIGVWVDTDDHVWIIHRSSATLGNNEKTLETKQGECCAGAPPVLEFTKDAKFLLQVGKKGGRRKAGAGAGNQEGQVAGFVGGSNDQESFGRVAKILVDQRRNRRYIAAGYLNKRAARSE